MLGEVLAGLGGFSQSMSDAFAKKLTGENQWRTIAVSTGIPALLAIIALFFVGIPSVTSTFWIITAITLPLEIAGGYALLRAVQGGELSLVSPLSCLTPAIMLFITWLFAIEPISTLGSVGIVLVVVGAFVLMTSSVLGTVHAITHTSGRWMLLATIIWSATSLLGKQAVLRGGVILYLATLLSAVSIVCFALYSVTQKKNSKRTKSKTGTLITKGFIDAVGTGLNNVAYLFAPAAVVIAIKRTSTFWSLLWGRILFKEQFGVQRVLAAIVMFSGVLCIVFG